MIPLEKLYSGDKAFKQFINSITDLIEPSRSKWQDWSTLVSLCGNDEQIARGVFYIGDVDSLKWIHEPCPALEGLSALDCMKTSAGKKRLKEAILRFAGMS